MKVAFLDPSRLSMLYSQNLCRELAKQGLEIDLITSHFLYGESPSPGLYQELEHFYRWTRNLYLQRPRGPLRRYVKGTEHVVDMFRLVRLLGRKKPDIIHFQQAPLPIVDSWFLSRLRRIAPVVSTVHNTTPFHGDAPRVQRMGFRSLLTQFDHIIVHTDFSSRCLVDTLGIPADRVSVIQGGLYDHYLHGTAEMKNPTVTKSVSNEQTVLFFGNLSYYKGPDILLGAFARLSPERRQKTRLLIAGNPQTPIKPLQNMARDLGIEDRIEWDLRFIPDDEVHTIFSRATVVALPYRHIERSGVLTVALSYGKPIVATRVGGFAEILQEGVSGYLVEPDDLTAMAARLEDVLSDPAQAKAMGQAGMDLANQWRSWDASAGLTIDIYRNLIHARRSSQMPAAS